MSISDARPSPRDIGVRDAAKACGECSLCCKMLSIVELKKASGAMCQHMVPGKGCGIHAERPQVCSSYQCVWSLADPLDEQWRPDRAGFILNPRQDPSEVEVLVDTNRPDAWKREPFYSTFKRWSHPSATSISRVLVRTRGKTVVVFPDTEIELGPLSGQLPYVHSGYEMKDGRPQPYARLAPVPSTRRGS
jgi:hypothetical protein